MATKAKRLTLRTDSGDARRFNRLDVRVHGHVSLVPDSSPDDHIWEVLRPKAQPVVIGDLSATGLYFVSPVDFELGHQVWVELELHGAHYPIRGVVVRQQAQLRDGKKIYGYGVQFLRSRFAPRAVGAILEYLAQRIAVLKEQEGRRGISLRRILAKT